MGEYKGALISPSLFALLVANKTRAANDDAKSGINNNKHDAAHFYVSRH